MKLDINYIYNWAPYENTMDIIKNIDNFTFISYSSLNINDINEIELSDYTFNSNNQCLFVKFDKYIMNSSYDSYIKTCMIIKFKDLFGSKEIFNVTTNIKKLDIQARYNVNEVITYLKSLDNELYMEYHNLQSYK